MSLPTFVILAAMMVVAALGVILNRNPVRSALCLVSTLFLLAVTYVFLDAHLVAALQILVYAGAIMVLFLFVIMLLNLQVEPPELGRAGLKTAAGLASGLLVLTMAHLLYDNPTAAAAGDLPANFGTAEALAERLFTHFLLPFEITSILLLVAMVGAVVLAKRKVS